MDSGRLASLDPGMTVPKPTLRTRKFPDASAAKTTTRRETRESDAKQQQAAGRPLEADALDEFADGLASHRLPDAVEVVGFQRIYSNLAVESMLGENILPVESPVDLQRNTDMTCKNGWRFRKN